MHSARSLNKVHPELKCRDPSIGSPTNLLLFLCPGLVINTRCHPLARNLSAGSAPPSGLIEPLTNPWALWSLPLRGLLSLPPRASLAQTVPTCSGQLPLGSSSSSHLPTANSFLSTELAGALFCLQLPSEFLSSTDYYSAFLAWCSQTGCKLISVLISHSSPYTRALPLPWALPGQALTKSLSIFDLGCFYFLLLFVKIWLVAASPQYKWSVLFIHLPSESPVTLNKCNFMKVQFYRKGRVLFSEMLITHNFFK